jgi:hypothetical protein
MEDFEAKLNSILSSPETMSQIMALADSLSGKPAEATASTEEASPATPAPASSAPGTASSAPGTASSAPGTASPLSLLQQLDPAMLSTLSKLYQTYTKDGDEKTALLAALRPFLRPERQAKVERAIQITRLSRVIQAAFQLFREGDHV